MDKVELASMRAQHGVLVFPGGGSEKPANNQKQPILAQQMGQSPVASES